MQTRRQFLEHLGGLGLGLVFLPSLGGIAIAESAEKGVPHDFIFNTVESAGLAHYSYFIGDKASKTAVVIDPRRDVEVYLELAREHGLTITHILDTHIHADFVSGARELARSSGTAKICASVEGGPNYGFPLDVRLRHGDTVTSGRLVLEALHTPGHTPEHMSYLASTRETNPPWALFTGDFLFVGSIGRPDLMGVENTDRLANALFETVRTGYKGLPDELAIFPAHGPGSPCGAGIQKSTGQPLLGRERTTNPYLNLSRRTTFVETLLFAQPPVPYYWPRMKVVNERGPDIMGGLPKVKMTSPKEFASFVQDRQVQLLDTRRMLDFAGGHIKGAINIGYDPVISLWSGWLLDPKRPIALVLPEDGKSEDVVAWLARVGLQETVIMGLKGGIKNWIDSGFAYENFDTMSVHEVRETFPTDKMQLLDVRQPSEWDQGHIAGAGYMFLPEIPQRAKELDSTKPVVVYCGNGYRASIAASLLRRAGLDARSVPGSYTAWVAAGYPLEYPAQPRRASDTRRS